MSDNHKQDQDEADDSSTDNDYIELGQTPALSESFKDITPAHKRARRSVEEMIKMYDDGGDSRPLSIQGPFRTGKSALQYHAFRYAWANDIPAVYIEGKKLLAEFRAADEQLDDWIVDRVGDEVDALLAKEVDSDTWMPTGSSQSKRQDWVDGNIPEDVDSDQYVLIVDEVEEIYDEILNETEINSDNPLRPILDRPEILSILGMGQLSSFEFIGDADYGRLKPVPVPSVTVDHVEALLDKRGADSTFGRVGYWLTRGRAARVDQVVSDVQERDLSHTDDQAIRRWLASWTPQQSKEYNCIRQLWEEDDIDQPANAAAALAFDATGYEDWLIVDESWHPAEELIETIEAIIRDMEPFTSVADEEVKYEARRMIRASLRRVVRPLAVPPSEMEGVDEQRAVPSTWLSSTHGSDETEATALLNITQDFLLSFEADDTEDDISPRDVSFDAIDAAKEEFESRYNKEMATVGANEGRAWTVRPSVLAEAFPPLATDPSRLTNQSRDALEADMDRGLEIEVTAPATVYACPTQNTFEAQLQRLHPDPTHPVAILVSDTVDIEEGLSDAPIAQALAAHSILEVETISRSRVWELVAQLHGRLADETDQPYLATQAQVDTLVENATNREDKTTISTLYQNLSETLAQDVAVTVVEAHRTQFGVDETPLWNHPDLAGKVFVNPGAQWSNGRLASAMQLILGSEPEWDSEGKALMAVRDGLENDDIDHIQNKFKYKELLTNAIRKDGGYGKSAREVRTICRQDDDSGPTNVLRRTQDAFQAVVDASEYDNEELLTGLFEHQSGTTASDQDGAKARSYLEKLNPPETSEFTTDIVWTLMTGALARENPEIVRDKLSSVKSDFDGLIRNIETRQQEVTAAEDILAPDDVPSGGEVVEDELAKLGMELEEQMDKEAGDSESTGDDNTAFGIGIELDDSHLTTYHDNTTKVRDGLVEMTNRVGDNVDCVATGYAVAILASRYKKVIEDAVDNLERGTPTEADLNHVKQLRDQVQELCASDSDPDISKLSDRRGEGITEHAQDFLDLQSIANSGCISVGNPNGDGIETILEVNRVAGDRQHHLRSLTEDLDDLVQTRVERERKHDTTKRLLKGLISQLKDPDEEIGMDASDDTAGQEEVSDETDSIANETTTQSMEEANDD